MLTIKPTIDEKEFTDGFVSEMFDRYASGQIDDESILSDVQQMPMELEGPFNDAAQEALSTGNCSALLEVLNSIAVWSLKAQARDAYKAYLADVDDDWPR